MSLTVCPVCSCVHESRDDCPEECLQQEFIRVFGLDPFGEELHVEGF